VLYVGSAHDSHQDQVLDEILVGPVPVGLNKFVLQADPPDPAKLPPDEVLGVTVVLVTCSYREKEFVRVGFYVNNEYLHPDYIATTTTTTTTQQPPALVAPASELGEGESGTMDATSTENTANVPSASTAAAAEKPLPVYPDLEMTYVQRHILADKPRITKFPISWGNETVVPTETTMMVTNDDVDRIMAPTPSPLGADPSPASPLSPMTTSMDVLMEG
jgi:ASF1 like histone chaperone